MSRLLRRMAGAARLDADTYEEVEADPDALGSALGVVLLTAAANAAGTWVHGTRMGLGPGPMAFQATLSALLPLVLWIGGSAFAYMMGASFFRGPHTQTDFAEVLRTTGFAFAPGLLLVAAWALPGLVGIGAVLAVRFWVLVAGIVAVRQALDFTTLRAVGTFGSAGVLLWLMVWGLSAAPLPF